MNHANSNAESIAATRARSEGYIAPLRSALSKWLTIVTRIACVVFASAVAPLCLADVSYAPGSKNVLPRITVFGQITKDDLRHFSGFARMARQDTSKFQNSDWGYIVF